MPQHERGDHLGPVRQVHLGGTLTASSRAATSGLAVLPAAFTRPPSRTQSTSRSCSSSTIPANRT